MLTPSHPTAAPGQTNDSRHHALSTKKEHTTQGGVDWELRTAEDAMVAAPGGSRELALAMRRHADGVRNMMVSELVPSFENAIDRIMEQRVVDVLASVQQSLDRQMDLVQQVLTAHKGAVRSLKKLQGQMKESQEDRKQIRQEVADVKEAVAALQERLDTYIAGSMRAEVKDLRKEIAALKQAHDEAGG